MKEGWKTKKLGEFCGFKNGRSFKKTEWKEEGLPIIRIANLNKRGAFFNYYSGEYDEKILIKRGDLLFAWSGTIGSSFGPHIWNSDDGLLNQHIYKVTYPIELDSKFMYYLFLEITSELEQLTTGAVGLVHVKKSTLNDFTVQIPPFSEQKQIVAILDQAFAAIDQAKANIEQNIVNAKELFQSKLNEIFSQKGDGWEEKKLGEVCEIGDGNYSSKYPKASEFVAEGIPFLTATNLKNGTIVPNKMRFISEEQHALLTKGHVHRDDLVIVVRGSSTGNNSLVPVDYEGSNLNSQLAYLRTDDAVLSPRFLYLGFNSPVVRKVVNATISGAAQPQLPNNKLLNISIRFPAQIDDQDDLVRDFDLLKKSLDEFQQRTAQKIFELDDLKKSILQKAFIGNLTEKEVPA